MLTVHHRSHIRISVPNGRWLLLPLVSVLLCPPGAVGSSADQQLETGIRAIQGRAGCYLVDYSFVETDTLKEGYKKDNRVYDVNRDKSVKEWIFTEQLSPTRIRLQHVLFAADLAGKVQADSVIKHTGEDWQYNAPFLYDYAGHSRWTVKPLDAKAGLWTRRITNLDDGLRYQCAAAFDLSKANPVWSCDNYAPIPGRETRDMARKDYQGLQRSSSLVSYGPNWLERERNVKTIENGDAKTPLVKELGKTWYARLPDAECGAAQVFVQQRLAFWLLTGQAWDKVMTGDGPFEDPPKSLHPSRYEQILDAEEKYIHQDLSNPATQEAARQEVLRIIQGTRGKPDNRH